VRAGPQLALVGVLAVLAVLGVGEARPASDAAPAWCSHSVSWAEARRSIGSVVRMRARVARTHFAVSARGRPTFIDVGRAAPNPRRVTVVIWGRHRWNFPLPPQRMFRPGRLICAHGIVSRHRGVARIQVEFWDATAGMATFQ
jgi:hypothetical protein